MTESPAKIIIVSDLDGSLLDHHSYSFEPARPLLQRLAHASIPVVLCTSKTCAEVFALRHTLNNQSPFIVENGAAVYLPKMQFVEQLEDVTSAGDYWCKAFCQSRSHWLELVEAAKASFGASFDHFANMSVAQVAALTGLTLKEAERAKAREFGEPLQWLGSKQQLAEATDWFRQRGAHVLSGGRFVHIAGDADKGQAMRWLQQQYQRLYPQQRIITLALGDSHNDVAMLEAADRAVVIRSPVHEPPLLQREDGFVVSSLTGPGGWAEGVQYWLSKLGLPDFIS